MDFTMIDEQLLTVDQRDRLLDTIDSLSMGIFKVGDGFKPSPTADVPLHVRDAIVLFLEKNKIDMKKITSVKNSFDELEKHLKNFPCVTIELAFEPTIRQLSMIAGKIELYGARPLLQTRVNEQLLAGAVLERNGKRVDYSVVLSS